MIYAFDPEGIPTVHVSTLGGLFGVSVFVSIASQLVIIHKLFVQGCWVLHLGVRSGVRRRVAFLQNRTFLLTSEG